MESNTAPILVIGLSNEEPCVDRATVLEFSGCCQKTGSHFTLNKVLLSIQGCRKTRIRSSRPGGHFFERCEGLADIFTITNFQPPHTDLNAA